jgi:hypothetical protein
LEPRERVLAQRHDAVLLAFAQAEHQSDTLDVDVVDAEADKLVSAQPRRVKDFYHRAIPQPDHLVLFGGEALGWRRSEALDESGRRSVEDVTAEVATIDCALELRQQGLSIPEIAATLEAEGRSTKRGGRWHPTTVQRLLARHGRTP